MPTCHDCIHAICDSSVCILSMPMGWMSRLLCTNHPDSPGQLRAAPLSPPCRNFRRKPHPAERTEPPAPADPSVRHIALTKGRFAIVDATDYATLSQFRWHATECRGRCYAATVIDGKSVAMHRMLMSPPRGMVVDHIDGNGLNNRRSNLRLCTPTQNRRNTRPRRKTSAFLGVSRRGDKYLARIKYQGRCLYLGLFDTEVEAARARDEKARELFGEFAWLNFPDASA